MHSSGVVAGVGNTVASLAAYVGPLFVAWLLEQYQSWNMVFGSVGVVNMMAAVAFACFSTAYPVDMNHVLKTS